MRYHYAGARKTGLDRNYEMSICQTGLETKSLGLFGFMPDRPYFLSKRALDAESCQDKG